MKRFIRLKTSLTTSLVIFFLIGAFDLARLFFHPEPSYPVLEKIIGAAHFLSIYILIGAFFGLVKSRLQSLFIAALAHERLGNRAKALETVDRLLGIWTRPDPDLPYLADARALKARLGGPGAARNSP